MTYLAIILSKIKYIKRELYFISKVCQNSGRIVYSRGEALYWLL